MAQFFFPTLPLNSEIGIGLERNFLTVSLYSLTRGAQYLTNCNKQTNKNQMPLLQASAIWKLKYWFQEVCFSTS